MSKQQVIDSISNHVPLARRYVDDDEFPHEAVGVAIAAGATTINVPDTLGYTTPEEIRGLFERMIANIPGAKDVVFSAHCHNDLGLAVANSLAAMEGGARQIECTINGIG